MRVLRVAVVFALVLAARPAFALCVVGDTGRCHIGTSACDVDTFCDGNGGPCPSGIQAAAGRVCRDAVAGGCDVAEVCDGVSASCPADAHQPAGTVCRQSVPGGCDIAESCNGSASCPADAHQPAGTVCRQAVPGGCDIAESCDGSASCPTDAHQPAGTVCRQAVPGGCDKTEACDGSASCPADAHQPAGTVCRQAVPGGCDIAEQCDGSASCPADVLQPDGHTCSDGNACTLRDACKNGACMAGDPPLVGSPVDFGPALVGGNPRSAIMTLSWHDTGSIAVTALSSSDAEFRVAAAQQFPIALSEVSPTAMITMEFVPTSFGTRTGSLTATVNPATCAVPPIALQGNGAPPGLAANPVGADFDQVDIGTTSAPKTFRIINLSGAQVVIQSITISDPVSFALAAAGLPATLAADDSYSFTVAAQPQTGGQHDADVIIVSNSTTTPMLTTTIHVEGTCAGAPCQVDPGTGAGSDGDGHDRASYYACSAGHAFAVWPVLLALALLRRRPRRVR